MDKRIRVGVDVGGTFTDLVLVDEQRDVIYTGKRLTTPGDPGVAILDGVQRLLRESDTDIGRLHSVVHGTTLVTNTIIQRNGAKVGLITTNGIRDALEMGRETRYDIYDLFLEKPEPLVPRYLRRTIAERIDADGRVLIPFDADEFRAVVRDLLAEGVEAIAVCFMHAYRNDRHERLAREILTAELGQIPVSISSEIAPEIREFERASTTVANAYVQPLMERYLARLERRLTELGLEGALYVMLSSGGITTVQTAQKLPIYLIESGPAAGAMAASYYGQLTERDHLISFDMGGTTAKMCLIEEGRPAHAFELEAGRVRRFKKGSGLPLKVPVVEMIEIGAGGGSIAHVDAMGLLKVGPRSAGSQPGPVCYGQGGAQPTVTDADLLLGYLSPDYFLGGEMRLDLAAVERAIVDCLTGPLGMDAIQSAIGIHDVVNESMAAAMRMHFAEKGRDPRRYAMIAFGGAGPVHAYGLAKRLKLSQIICPLGAGVTSALGFLVAAPAFASVRSYVARLDDLDWPHLNGIFADLEREAQELLVAAGGQSDLITFRRTADLRYVGQGFEVTTPIPGDALGPAQLPRIRAAFLATYEALFGRHVSELPVESMSWRLEASGPVPNVALNFGGQPTERQDPRKGSRQVYFPETGFAACTVYNRYALWPGMELTGPAVIEERESTTVVGPDAGVTVDRFLNLIIDIGG